VDGETGLLLADPAIVTRVRAAIEHRSGGRAPSYQGCGASLPEFAGLPIPEAAGVGVKVASMKAHLKLVPQHSLVLGCTPRSQTQTTLTTSWFAPCALPDERYLSDYTSEGWDLLARAEEMKALLDSLVRLPGLQGPPIHAADSLTLTLRRVVGGRERIFECTLDRDAFLEVARVLSNVFRGEPHDVNAPMPPASITRINLSAWTSKVDSRAALYWTARPTR
jgi:hypothetical protein